jgi:hypothetical protein
MKTSDEDIRKIEDLEDGSSVYEIGSSPAIEESENTDFYENIAEKFPEEARKKLSTFLLEGIEEDIVVRQKWLDPIEKAKAYLGFDLEASELKGYKQGTRTFDTTFSTAVIRFFATNKPELYPLSGPAGFKINGNSNEETDRKAELNTDYLNYYLTVKDSAYYPDCDRFLLNLGFCGTIFKKVYFDKLLKRPLSRFIMPENFVIDADCTSILESSRLTHILHLSKREIILNQQNKIFLDVDLPYLKNSEIGDNDDSSNQSSERKEKVDLSEYKKRSLFPIYEIHAYLTLDDFTEENKDSQSDSIVSLPYIVTIDKASKEILSISRNWDEDDEDKKQREYFVQYNYLPGFGIYGNGLAHLIGTNAISLTSIQRMLIDAGIFKNMPAGLRAKGFKQQDSTIIVGPGEWIEVDTNGLPLTDALMPLPYSEPSNALRELRLEMIQECEKLASTSELGMLSSKEDIPVGTTLALLETNNKIQSAVSSSIHNSFSKELQLLNNIFKKTLQTEEFNFGKERKVITSEDFVDEVMIIPVSDPAAGSSIQRIIKAESLLRTAMQAPELHDMREVFKKNYEAQGLDASQIDQILPAPPEEQEILPLDPVSENLNIMKNEPVKAAIWQDHAAHKLVHGLFAQDYPETAPAVMAHIKEHEALEYLMQMQQLLGMEMPPLEQILDPQVQNQIAVAIAGSLEENQENQPSSPSPEELILADIQQQQAEVEARERIEDQKTETAIFKAQLDFEKEKAKIESNEEIAQLKTEADLSKAQLAVEKEKAKIESNEKLAQLKAETELIKNGENNEEVYEI